MFPFGYNPYGSSYQSYDPYEQILLQQELQRRRQAEEYARRRQIEELNRRRAAQLEYARREAELQRRREAEAARQRQLELEARRRKLSEPARPRVRVGGPGSRHSMFDGGIQDLFDALYGHTRPRSPSPSAAGRRSASSAPKAERVRSPSAEPKSRVRFAPDDQSAVSDSEDQAADGEASKGIPITVTTADETMDTTPDQVDSSPSRKAVDEILSKFAKLKSEFIFPSKLDFLPSPEGASTPTPKLAYTLNNAPLHQYEHLLTGLLTQLDAVESYGDAEVRKARKDAVKEIEKELEELDVKKVQDWRSQFEPPVVVEPTPKPAPDGEKVEEVSSNTEVAPDAQTSAQAQASFDPASVPLPQGEDRDLHMDIISEPNPTVSEPIATDTTPAQPVSGVEDAEAHLPQPAADTQSSEDVHLASAMPRPSSPVPDPHADRTIISGQETPVKPAQETPTATVPASEAEHDTTEEDYVNITSEAKSAHGEDDDGKIKDDWQLEF